MRYIENTITPKRGWFHPVDKLVETDPSVERKSIQQINLLEDDTVVMLYELAGDREYIETLVDDHFEALAYSTSEVGDNTLVWAHIEPSSLVERLLRIPQGVQHRTPDAAGVHRQRRRQVPVRRRA